MIPEIDPCGSGDLIRAPRAIEEASGILVRGKRLRSFVFSTDVAILRNANADAVIALYPFHSQPIITQAILAATDAPVFCGIGGVGEELTEERVINLAKHAEYQGAAGVVMAPHIPAATLSELSKVLNIPIIVSVVTEKDDVKRAMEAGASVLNVAAAEGTPDVIRRIRTDYPYMPIMATGGPTEETIRRTIEAGANAITFTPPTVGECFRAMSRAYRGRGRKEDER